MILFADPKIESYCLSTSLCSNEGPRYLPSLCPCLPPRSPKHDALVPGRKGRSKKKGWVIRKCGTTQPQGSWAPNSAQAPPLLITEPSVFQAVWFLDTRITMNEESSEKHRGGDPPVLFCFNKLSEDSVYPLDPWKGLVENIILWSSPSQWPKIPPFQFR